MMDISISNGENRNNAVSYQVRNYLTISIAVILVAWYALFLWKRRNLYIHSWSVEGPLAFPFIGCGYLMLGNKNGVIEEILKILENFKSGLWKLWLGPKLLYMVSEPEHIEKILNHPKALNKEDVYRFVGDAIGYGLLTAPAKKWKKHRKLLAPAFNQKILDSFVEVFAEQSIVFADELKSVVGQKDFDLYLLATRCTLDTVCQTIMGVNMNTQKGKSVYGTALDKAMEMINHRIFKVWYHLDLVWHFSYPRKVVEKNTKILQDMTFSVVSKKWAEHNKNKEVKNSYIVAETDEEPTHKRLAVLDLILKESVLTEKELTEEVTIFLAAGTETSASSICFLFMMLGMHPEVQQNVYEEVMDILGPDRSVVASDLPQMKYTERMIKENLRLFPIAIFFGRSLEEDIDLGWKYAIANLKTIIATVIRRYKIYTSYKSVEEIELKINLLLRTRNGPKVWIEHR